MNGLGLLIGIVKGIGIVLLILVALILLFLCLVLCVPFRYQISAKKFEVFQAKLRIQWLLKLLRLEIAMEEGQVNVSLRLFGRRIFSSSTDKKEEESIAPPKPLEAAEKTGDKKTSTTQKVNQEPAATIDKKPAEKAIVEKELTPKPQEPAQKKPAAEAGKAQGPAVVRRVKMTEIEETTPVDQEVPKEETQRNEEQLKEEEEPTLLRYFLSLSFAEKKELIGIVFSYLKKILRHVAPKESAVYLEIGAGDPALTGYVMALSGAAAGFLGQRFRLKGNFTEVVVRGTIDLEGKIMLGKLLWESFCLIRKKPIWKCIQIYRGKGEKHE